MSPGRDENGTRPAATDPIEQLVRIAGPREPVPGDRLARLKAAARSEWQAHTRARRWRTRLGWSIGGLAIAALLVLAVRLGGERWGVARVPGRELAAVEQVRGAVTRVPSLDAPRAPAPVKVGERLREGDRIATSGGGWLAVRLAGGGTLQLDRGTRVRWLSAAAVALDEGTVYVSARRGGPASEADPGGSPASFEIHTAFGIVREIGTQFEVRVDPAALRVRVREGLVRVSGQRASHDVRAGNEMTLAGDGRIAWRPVPAFGPDWAWATILAAPYQIEGGSLQSFLDWVAGETGLHIRFARRSDEQQASTMILHGSIDGLSPDQALDAVLPASGVDHELIDGELVIRGIADDTGR